MARSALPSIKLTLCKRCGVRLQIAESRVSRVQLIESLSDLEFGLHVKGALLHLLQHGRGAAEKKSLEVIDNNGAPGMTRTCDLLVRSQTLYPTELRARTCGGVHFSNNEMRIPSLYYTTHSVAGKNVWDRTRLGCYAGSSVSGM